MKQRWIVRLTIVGVLALWAAGIFYLSFVFAGQRYFALWDDTMISMRYAYQAAHGNGLVWNIGERVQGYSNLGWTWVMVALHWLNLPLRWNSLVVQMVNAGFFLGLLVVVYRAGQRLLGERAWYAMVLLATCWPLLFWGVLGAESILQAYLVSLAVLPLLGVPPQTEPRRYVEAVAWLTLAFVVRADSAVLLAAVWALGSWRLWRLRVTMRQWFLWVFLLAGSALTVGGILFWQHSYYGSWLPNTFALKAAAGTRQWQLGVQYLWGWLWRDRYIVAVVLAAIGVWHLRGKSRWPVLALALVWLSYVVWVGGDYFDMSRFVVPMYPVFMVFAAIGLTALFDSLRRVRLPWFFLPPVVIACLLGIMTTLQIIPALLGLQQNQRANRERAAVALALPAAGLRHNQTVAVFAAGIIPYFLPDYRFHDLLGKTDRQIAASQPHNNDAGHNKWDFTYSLNEVQPAVVVYSAYVANDQVAAEIVANKDHVMYIAALWLDPIFRDRYLLQVHVPLIAGEPARLLLVATTIDAGIGQLVAP